MSNLLSIEGLGDSLDVEQVAIEVQPTHDILVLAPAGDVIELETDVLTGLGPRGAPGESPPVSKYLQSNVAITGGVLTLNAAAASTFWVYMDQDVTSLVVENWPADRTQRVMLYAEQDGVGGHTFSPSAFPAGTKWSYGVRPTMTDPGGLESFILEHLPGGRVLGALVGRGYA